MKPPNVRIISTHRFIGKVPAVVELGGVHREVLLPLVIDQKPPAKPAVIWLALLGILFRAVDDGGWPCAG